jgi:RHS repeat-associated protein
MAAKAGLGIAPCIVGVAAVVAVWSSKSELTAADYFSSTDVIYVGTNCTSSFTDQPMDGSGFTLTVTSSAGTMSIGSVYTSSGAVYNGNTLKDSNGNEISYNLATFTDTFGLTGATATTSVQNIIGAASWTDANGDTQTLTPTYTSYTLKSSFGCAGLADFTDTGIGLPTQFSLPDSTALGLTWEPNEVTSGDVTGRLAQITLRSGSTVQFNYNPSNLGASSNYNLNCTYLVPNSMTRTTSDGTVAYSWAHTSTGNTTTVLDIGQNKTVYTFSAPGVNNTTAALTEIQYFANTGSITAAAYASTATNTITYCYNSGPSPTVSSCPTASVTLPVTELAVFTSPNGLSPSETYQTFDNFGNVMTSAQYDFALPYPATPLIATTNVMAVNGSGSCSNIGATINNKVCSSTTAILGNTVAMSKYTYSATGNLLTTSVSPNGGTSYLSNSTANSYNSNGTPSALYDFNNNATTFAYNSGYYTNCTGCTQYPFATRRTKGGLNTYAIYNGYSGVKTEDEDANSNDTNYYYATTTSCSIGTTADPWSRVLAVCDPLNNEVFKTYSATSLTSRYSFGSSVNNVTTTLDGYGRTINVQRQQGPSSPNWDTVSTYRGFSTVIPTTQTTNPCSMTSGLECGTTYGPTVGGSVLAGGLFEATLTQSGSNATITTEYDQNTTLKTLSPFPSGENNKETQNVYNGAGWLTSACGISSLVSGNVLCSGRSHGIGPSGILTTVSYSSGTPSGSMTVQSCRGASGSQQCRTTTTDGLGRVISKITPEGGTWTYTYDTACSSSYTNTAGRLAETVDPNGNTLCYSYDALGRILLVNATNGATTSCRWFYYDNGEGSGTTSGGYTGTIPSGISLSNQYGRMVEATTDACTAVGSHTSSTLITDEWWAYDKDGRPTAEWELTPNSTQYYESTATYTGPALIAVDLASPSEFTATYNLDGEGRWNALTVGANVIVPSLGVTYNAASQPTQILLGTGTDQDDYTYWPDTLLMKAWEFQVNSVQENAILSWNPNNTLKQLAITDGFNANGSMTCSYNSGLVSGTGYDDLNRLIGFSCTGAGGTWGQAFSYDQFTNITTAGTNLPSWNPTYSLTTNHYACSGCTNDSNGNVTNDGTTAYSWNVFSKMASVNMSGIGCATNGDCIVYDALGRAVEIDDGATKTEIWYTPLGKTAFMNGTTFRYSYEPAPGGGTVYSERYYFHKDWMGNARIQSLVPGTPSVYTDRAFTPYGVPFDIFGGTGQSDTLFAGLTQDIFSGMYDTPNRELTAVQSRFMSPDPAGFGWNQYAYPTNPNSAVDPSGLQPGGIGGPTCLVARRLGSNMVPSTCAGGPTDGGGGGGDDGGDDGGFLGSDGFGDPFAGAGGPSISPLEGNLEDENMAALVSATGPGLDVSALLAGPQDGGGSVGADSFQFSTQNTDDFTPAPTLLNAGENAQISEPGYGDLSGDILDVNLMLADFTLAWPPRGAAAAVPHMSARLTVTTYKLQTVNEDGSATYVQACPGSSIATCGAAMYLGSEVANWAEEYQLYVIIGGQAGRCIDVSLVQYLNGPPAPKPCD